MRTLGLIKPGVAAPAALREVVEASREAGLSVEALGSVQLSQEEVEEFYAAHRGRFFFPRLVLFMLQGPVLPLLLHGPHAVPVWRRLIGPAHRHQNRILPCLRGRWAVSDTRNAFHGSGSEAEAEQEIAFFNRILAERL